jgi:glycosyltransferase involved in cell wall biosynthesis
LKRKNILIISYSFPPSNAPAAQRPYAFAKYLDKSKFNVTVLTCLNQDSSMGLSSKSNTELNNVEIIKVKSINLEGYRTIKKASMVSSSEQKTSLLKRKLFNFFQMLIFPDKGIFWVFYVLPFFYKNRDKFRPDVVFSTSPLFSNHLVALFIMLFNKKAKYISDFRDYHFIENELQNGIKGKLNRFLEKRVLKKSDYSCFISDSMTETYKQYYPKFGHKFRAIYNGYDIDEFSNFTNVVSSKKLTFFYAGSFYKGVRSPKPLLLILEFLLENDLIKKNDFRIEIAGNFENKLVEELQSLKVFENIEFLGLISREKVLKKYLESHVLWLIVGNRVNHFTGVPIKMYEYLGSKRPILNFSPLGSEPERIINDLQAGWNIVNDENDIQIKSKIVLQIFEKYKNKELNTPMDYRDISKYLRAFQTKTLEQLING